jgi:hypothetical protein
MDLRIAAALKKISMLRPQEVKGTRGRRKSKMKEKGEEGRKRYKAEEETGRQKRRMMRKKRD